MGAVLSWSGLIGQNEQSDTVASQVSRAVALLKDAQGLVVTFTGAGISASSGVPTYRDEGGLWIKYDQQKVSHIAGFLRNPLACWRFELELYRILKGCRYNAAHAALAQLERSGLLLGVITQNVDGFHTAAGSASVIELHGNETRAICMNPDCRKTIAAEDVFRELRWITSDGEIIDASLPDDDWIRCKHEDELDDLLPSEMASLTSGACDGAPRCQACGALLKPDAVYFGEDLDEKTLLSAKRLVRRARCMIVVGSNCSVAPANTFPSIVKRQGGSLIEVNPRRSQISDLADVRLVGDAAVLLPRLADAFRKCVSSHDSEQQRKRQKT
eukprot:TRINITY_DN57673_c0_g1_i1.p1 TRINITY_DN57673_c0_g1~~TRINITY_DN57673_c0_g1_i1.p1  ORF type:complete len:329 (-),score=45.15 TRINITY_DN57673_c0_g1_i1:128-1114(-)